MRKHFPMVFETDASGVISAYVPGLPVYAQGTTQLRAERAIRNTLWAYLEAHPDSESSATIKVAAFRPRVSRRAGLVMMSPAALVGTRTSTRKAAASRANGLLGGRPRRVGLAKER